MARNNAGGQHPERRPPRRLPMSFSVVRWLLNDQFKIILGDKEGCQPCGSCCCRRKRLCQIADDAHCCETHSPKNFLSTRVRQDLPECVSWMIECRLTGLDAPRTVEARGGLDWRLLFNVLPRPLKDTTIMDRETLKSVQAPLKQLYQTQPEAAIARLQATGVVDFERIGCRVALPCHDDAEIIAGLHPKAGGDGVLACSGDMLLQALVSCAGTTLAAVATAMGLPITSARIEAIGHMDFRGTLGVDRSVPIGLTGIELVFHIESEAQPEQVQKLIQLAERYCVVLQTLTAGVRVSSRRG